MNLLPKTPTSFTTTRFLVRRYELTDVDSLFQGARASIPEVFEYLPWCHPDYSHEEAKSWIANVENDWRSRIAFNFGIFDRDGTNYHGGCGLNQLDEHAGANLGYWIKTESTGKGAATEVTRGLIRFGIEYLKLQRIEIVMSVKNTASSAVALSAGGRYEGKLRNRLLLHGVPHDAHLYSIVPDDLSKA